MLAGRYQLNAVCGEGTTSIIYEATQVFRNRTVAVKVLRPEMCSDGLCMQAFQSEAQVSSRFSHPSIVSLWDLGISDSGQPFIVLEYLQGGSLADKILQDQSLPNDLVIEIFIQICSALELVHKFGFVHRSINVTKIMFEKPDGSDRLIAKLIGFSRAKKINEIDINLTSAAESEHQVRRLSLYISPEHARGQEIDGRADIYATGCTMYQALTGEIPLKGENVYHTIRKHLAEAPVPMSVLRRDLKINKDLEKIVAKAMQKNPNDRFQSMSEMQKALERIRR
jgi:serine/threonine-protein kinase